MPTDSPGKGGGGRARTSLSSDRRVWARRWVVTRTEVDTNASRSVAKMPPFQTLMSVCLADHAAAASRTSSWKTAGRKTGTCLFRARCYSCDACGRDE